MDLKESNNIMYHAFEAAYEIACGKLDTDDDFYSEYYSENDCMVALMEMQSLHDKIVNMLKAIDLLAISAGINCQHISENHRNDFCTLEGLRPLCIRNDIRMNITIPCDMNDRKCLMM